MNQQQQRLFVDIPTAEEQYADDRDNELDRTPRLAARESLAAVLDRFEPVLDHASRTRGWIEAVDVCAGAGPWASELRQLCFERGRDIRLHAIEKRSSELPFLQRWCDTVEISLFKDALMRAMASGRRWDILVGNPNFTGLAELLPLARSVAQMTVLLHTEQAFTKGKAMRAVIREHPPVLELRIGGDIHFRGAQHGADMRPYSVSVWLNEGRDWGSGWPTEVLELSDAARRWRQVPGGEQSLVGLATAPGWSPQQDLFALRQDDT